MFTDPASKASVPLAVVRRILSSVPERVTVPPLAETLFVVLGFRLPLSDQISPPSVARQTIPLCVYPAWFPAVRINPVVNPTAELLVAHETYPLVVIDPAPI